jgi:hypothetical protein
VSRTARSRRLIDLYNLRAQVNSEIAKLEAAIVGEVRLIREQWAAEDPPPPRRRVAECGTDGGYHHHRRQKKEPACHACLEAHSAAERDRVMRRAAS